ncbi:EAL domain-containing protein [Vibrio sp. RC27]
MRVKNPVVTIGNSKNPRPTIAVLVGTLASTFQEGIMRGAAHVAEQHDYNIIGYCGGVINSPAPLSLARAKVFDLIDTDFIAGVISPFSSHMRYLDERESQSFVDRFTSVPVVNIGSYLDGYTNVVSDYEDSFTKLLAHLYHEHGYRNICLMRGPEQHGSSEQRCEIYKRLMAEYNLPFDEEMIIYSDLNGIASKSKFQSFWRKKRHPIDAVITLNDNQALGVISACECLGIRVPEDLAVIGSMNTLEGMFASPKLTSMQEPLFELGQAAALELIAQIDGALPSKEIRIPTSLVIRQSCGCRKSSAYKIRSTSYELGQTPIGSNDDPIFEEMRANLFDVIEKYKGGVERQELDHLLDLFKQAVCGYSIDDFVLALTHKLENSIKSEDVVTWLALATILQRATLKYLEFNRSKTLLELQTQLVNLKDDVGQLSLKFQLFETDYYLNYFRFIVNDLNSSFDLSKIKNYAIDILNLTEFHISVFKNTNEDMLVAKNLVSVSGGIKNSLSEKDNDFIAKNLIPESHVTIQERYSLMVFPLSFRDKPIGFMVTNLSNKKGTAFENLRAIISSALKNELLIQDLTDAEKRFSDIAHSTSNWLWETNVENRFTYCSESVTDIVGYRPEQMIGRVFSDFDIEGDSEFLHKIRNQEILTDQECWCRHRNGSVIHLLISATPIEIRHRFSGYRGIFEDITEQKLQENKIKALAYSDILTALPNRTLFQQKLKESIVFSKARDEIFALMFIDLDHFKNINDSLGHAAGDLLLVEIAKRLKEALRSQDIIARFGGDEFTIILPNITNKKEIVDIINKIFNNTQAPIVVHGKPIYCTLSIGVSLYPYDGDDTQTLLQRGDSAMYLAKSQGRNGYVFYDKFIEKKNAERNMYEAILREAIVSDGFYLELQPQVSASTGLVVGFEALVRIKSPEYGVIGPYQFISLAEELGLIGQIDEWVFEAVCAHYRDWCKRGIKPKRISVNLSAMQLCSATLLTTYINILKKYDVDPGFILLEITENALIQNEKMALRSLQGFQQYGVSIALDDFGTGYSSLSCINLYPIDVIKIDRSFIIDAVENSKNKAIIEAIVLIAKNLELNVVAEGVETQEQYQFIRNLGCHAIQGYYFYRPLSVAQAEALLDPM